MQPNLNDLDNPFPDRGYKPLDPGTHKAQLTAIDVKDLPNFDGSEGTRAVLLFRFETETGDVITKLVNATNHEKSNCVRFVKMISPGIPTATLNDRKALWTHVKGLIGRFFEVTSIPTDDGRYNNVTTATPCPEAPAASSPGGGDLPF